MADEAGHSDYLETVKTCVDVLMKHGTDRYGEKHTPLLVSILDVNTLACPQDPDALDEYFRVTRRGRRSPGGANLMTDQPLLRTLFALSVLTGEEAYADFARRYISYYLANLVDDRGFIWWGWHRHYDVFREVMDGHNKSYHEIHAITEIDWERLWQCNEEAVRREIEAIWEWHVIDKVTGEVNRHGDGRRGCDFSMSAGACIEAFAFYHTKAGGQKWADRAKLLATYYWQRRNPETDLFPERPNAGKDRFDGSRFVTSIPGLHCPALLKAWQLTGDDLFKDYATAYLRAYAKYGFDADSGKFWGALDLDGSPIPGPRVYTENIDSAEGYAANQPRGHLDLWGPYVAGYQYPIYTAQAYAYAYQLTGDKTFLQTARRFAEWIRSTPPGTLESESSWYRKYAAGAGRQGTYAGKYGRVISFFVRMYALTQEPRYLEFAAATARESIKKLGANGLFRGHPAKPYYEAIDGVGYLLYGLVQLHQAMQQQPRAGTEIHTIPVGREVLLQENR